MSEFWQRDSRSWSIPSFERGRNGDRSAGISSAPSLLPNGVGEGRKRASADLPRTRSSPQPPSAPPPRRLFADNLPRDAAEEEVRALF